MILNSAITGDGPPLILLHGLFGSARNLGHLSRGLGAQAKVLAMDLRNHGESPHGQKMDFATLAADVAQTCASLGISQARVAGHSLGGKTAMALALTHPALVERLAVLDIAPVKYQHAYDGYVQAMQAIQLTPGLTRHEADASLAKTVREAPLRAFLLNNLVLGGQPRWRVALAEIGAAMPDLVDWPEFPGTRPYTGPTLFLRGAESDYVRPSAGEKIANLFPEAVQISIEGASHWLHADRPEQTLAALKNFFFP